MQDYSNSNARAMLEITARAKRRAEHTAARRSEPFVIGCHSHNDVFHLTKPLRQMKERFPDFRPVIQVIPFQHLYERLSEETVDVVAAFREGRRYTVEVDLTETPYLTVTLENLEITEGLVAGVLDRNIFDEHGGVEDVSKSDLLLQEPVTSSKVEFDDLTAYYKTNIYVNVFKEDGDLFTPVTNRTSQLEYFVTFGRVEKTIDCGAADTDPIKQTVISGTVPAEYVGKDLYLVLKENREAFITSIQAGGDIDEGTYEGKCTSEDTEVKFVIDTPSFVKSYSVFLVSPEEGVPYLEYALQDINYDLTEVNFTFKKEEKKRIVVTAIRGEEPLNDHEAYLIESEKWPEIKEIVEKEKGRPEEGMYVEKKTIVSGQVVFEVFCTEGEKEYKVYIPKWNSGYYDSYHDDDVTVNSTDATYPVNIKYPYEPVGGGGGIEKTVSIEVTLNEFTQCNFGFDGAYVYVLNDAEKLKDAINSGLGDFEGLYKSDTKVNSINDLPLTFSISQVKFSTDKDIAIFVYPIMDFTDFGQKISIVRERGANITDGFKVNLSRENFEYIP